MNRENEDLSESRPEIAAFEASLAQLRPRRQARFADVLKNQLKDALSNGTPSDKTPASGNATATVKIPLTHYIRIAQFNAAVGGLFAGLFIGVLLGGACAYFVLSRFETEPMQPVQSRQAARSPYVQMLLDSDTSLTPLERALFDRLDKEPGHGRK